MWRIRIQTGRVGCRRSRVGGLPAHTVSHRTRLPFSVWINMHMQRNGGGHTLLLMCAHCPPRVSDSDKSRAPGAALQIQTASHTQCCLRSQDTPANKSKRFTVAPSSTEHYRQRLWTHHIFHFKAVLTQVFIVGVDPCVNTCSTSKWLIKMPLKEVFQWDAQVFGQFLEKKWREMNTQADGAEGGTT